jgi:hypothetical protein
MASSEAMTATGIGGALLWVVGVFVVQMIGVFVAFLFVAMAGDEKAINRTFEQTLAEHGITLIAGEMAVFVLGPGTRAGSVSSSFSHGEST